MCLGLIVRPVTVRQLMDVFNLVMAVIETEIKHPE